MSLLQRLIDWFTGDSAYVAGVNAQFAAMDRAAARVATTCPICNGTDVYLCPKCLKPIDNHSHENDFICDVHGFVNPVRQSDGAVMNGLGYCGDQHVLVPPSGEAA